MPNFQRKWCLDFFGGIFWASHSNLWKQGTGIFRYRSLHEANKPSDFASFSICFGFFGGIALNDLRTFYFWSFLAKGSRKIHLTRLFFDMFWGCFGHNIQTFESMVFFDDFHRFGPASFSMFFFGHSTQTLENTVFFDESCYTKPTYSSCPRLFIFGFLVFWGIAFISMWYWFVSA